MNNLILFVNQFLSYILLMAIIVVVGAIGFTVGVKTRKTPEGEADGEQGEPSDSSR
ncbi:MAG: hypothetical protein J5842_05950 [Lachnospiraceae bacterium]|nr:hypothetical protein [Lachnospiraceae bacterium]